MKEERGVAGRPLVSIGMPVYNGERFLAQALDCLLAQDYTDFELVISDNTSTDDTPNICREYAEADPRIKYFRNEANLGATRNFNRVFELAVGEYFMWAAHDDEWDPSYIRRCLSLLEKHPSAVGAISEIIFIDEDGNPLPGQHYKNINTLGMDILKRVHEIISRTAWFDIYGLIRREALHSTHLFQKKYGPDVLLLLELLLQGDFVVVPEPLFRYRLPERRKTVRNYVQETTGNNSRCSAVKPFLNMARDLLWIVDTSNLDPGLKQEIRVDFVCTLAFQNRIWRTNIMREQGLPSSLWHYPAKQLLQLMSESLAPTSAGEDVYVENIGDKRGLLKGAFFLCEREALFFRDIVKTILLYSKYFIRKIRRHG